MVLIQRLIKIIKQDRERLQHAAVALELARVRGSDSRLQERKASKLFSRQSAMSAEFLIPYMVMTLALTLNPPFDASSPDSWLRALNHAYWLIGFSLHYIFIYWSAAWLLYYLFFPFGYLAYLIGTVVLYTASSIALMVVLFAAFPDGQPISHVMTLPFRQLLIMMPVLIAAMATVATAYRVMHDHPLFSRASDERKFFALIPYEMQGELISVSADDHYLNVITSRGESHIRLQFSKALEMLEDVKGVQIHRSHWVKADAVRQVYSEPEGKTVVKLVGDIELPVARARVKTLRETLTANSFK